ncbi:lysosomal-associated transmembrane protein 4B [Daktulosphaira vitifoliae]|uniref:lysosomal-associated transmembrane protein 4B n=1 Tax=Daktulosphaira vitifoliae TaxID=58002 RepID=UPI0021AA8B75|nr:lysosomal-associated transmembrane protein 4B [Daktulosphaira vitifoliae]
MTPQQLPHNNNTTLKFIERRKNEWRCLLCCHVRTATIFLGLWHLMLQLLALSTLVVLLRHPELLKPYQLRTNSIEHNDLPIALAEQNIPVVNTKTDIPTFLNYESDEISPTNFIGVSTKNDRDYLLSYGMFVNHQMRYEELNFAAILILCMIFITVTMIYGAIKGKPKLLMPFFCMRLFDLFVTTLTALGYLCYLPDLQRMIKQSESNYVPQSVSSLNPNYVSLIIILSFAVSIISQGYFVAVMWSCYKYLTFKLVSSRPTIHYIESNFAVQNLLHPDYDFSMKKFPPPPPSYSATVADTNISTPNISPPPYN